MFLSPYIISQIKEGTYGAALMQININDLRKLVVNIPPIENQKSIVTTLDDLDFKTRRLVELYQRKLHELESLKKASSKKRSRANSPSPLLMLAV